MSNVTLQFSTRNPGQRDHSQFNLLWSSKFAHSVSILQGNGACGENSSVSFYVVVVFFFVLIVSINFPGFLTLIPICRSH